MDLIKLGPYYISVSVGHRYEILIDHRSFHYIEVEILDQVNYLFGTFCPVLISQFQGMFVRNSVLLFSLAPSGCSVQPGTFLAEYECLFYTS